MKKISFLEGHRKFIHFSSRYSSADVAASRIFRVLLDVCYIAGVFLPGLVSPEKCCGKDGRPNKPLCLAWSSPGRNHYITLVGVKGTFAKECTIWFYSFHNGFSRAHTDSKMGLEPNRIVTYISIGLCLCTHLFEPILIGIGLGQ